MTKVKLSKTYDPHSLESDVYQRWEERGSFSPQGKGESYCIMIPPPNVTGSLHMGHAFQNTLMDALIRYHRMKGYQTLWQAGTDHAGIATQMVVERLLQAKGISRRDLGRKKFIDQIWKWKANSGGTITNQLRRLGASLDWTRERFTMDDELSDAVQEVFIRLYNEGLIYRGKRLVNWDPVLLTAISDLEVISAEESGSLWHFRYPITGSDQYIVIATTRPETMLGDSAVAVHPDDNRYSHLVGKTVTLPLVNREIPVIADRYVDPEFGTGCLKITPAHDFNDFAVGERHNLEIINIMTPHAEIDLPGTKYHGLDRMMARNVVVTDLRDQGLLEQVDDHLYQVPRGDRTGEIIEPFLTDQWFVRAEPIAKPAIEAVKSGKIRFVPKNWERTYFDWMENIQDWCISRQIWWGHRVPAWYDDEGNVFVARSEQEAKQQAHQFHGHNESNLKQDNDVLDTWFSSALWPFSTLGWPNETDELKTFYPTSVLVTGFDIIFFWVARMIMFGLKFTDDIPFHEVYIHGLVRDAEGQKMSKSKGNILDPLDLIDGISLEDLIEKRTQGLMQPELAPSIIASSREQFPNGIPSYGTDALRFTFARLATQGRDIRFDLGRIEGYRNFCNKLWNAARFVSLHTEHTSLQISTSFLPSTTSEKWILSELHTTTQKIEESLKIYRFDIATKELYEFVWNEFCAWFIEFAKISLRSENISEADRDSLKQTLLIVLDASLRLLHPFMPFISDEIWERLCKGNRESSIMFQPYVSEFVKSSDAAAVQEINWVKEVVSAIRNLRGELNIKPGERVALIFQSVDKRALRYLNSNLFLITELAKVSSSEIVQDHREISEDESKFVTALVDDFRILLPISEMKNLNETIQRLKKEIKEHNITIKRCGSKLNNEQFLNKAPAQVVQKVRNQLSSSRILLAEIEQQYEKFSKISLNN